MNALQGSDGKISMMRVATGVVVFSVMSVFIAHNIVSMVKGCGFISMGASEAMLVAGALAAKAGQHFGERANGKKVATTNEIPVGKGQ